jgi:hypothetical protein
MTRSYRITHWHIILDIGPCLFRKKFLQAISRDALIESPSFLEDVFLTNLLAPSSSRIHITILARRLFYIPQRFRVFCKIRCCP